jgi:predicted nucleic acid-binding protein
VPPPGLTLQRAAIAAPGPGRRFRDHQISYWDAQLWATALRHGATVVLSEDFSDGQTIEGVTFKDPFASGFDLKTLASTT